MDEEFEGSKLAAEQKYSPLGLHLKGRQDEVIRLSFTEIVSLVGTLPATSATPQFWANTGDHHVTRRRQWLDAGYLAFFEEPSVVRFERIAASEYGSRWDARELKVCVMAYWELLRRQSQLQALDKARLRQQALGELPGRTASAYEYRMQNITAVLDELGEGTVHGYAPMRNVGSAKPLLIQIINEVWMRTKPELPTDSSAQLATRVASAARKLATKPEIPIGERTPRKREVITYQFLRDPNVIAWVLNKAAGHCELCGSLSPFFTVGGTHYLEVHHVEPLAKGGPDTVDNAVALCANCHRELHFGAEASKARKRLILQVSRLRGESN